MRKLYTITLTSLLLIFGIAIIFIKSYAPPQIQQKKISISRKNSTPSYTQKVYPPDQQQLPDKILSKEPDSLKKNKS